MLNEMMDRPIVMDKVLDFMRTRQQDFTGPVREIQAYAQERKMPIIPHETAVFIDFLLSLVQPYQVLEVGTAVGFSAALMAQRLAPGGQVTTIERNPRMSQRAAKHFSRYGLDAQIRLLEGDAQDILPVLEADSYDVIFMDSAKAKYVEFLPECYRLLKAGGILMIDDIFQGGTVLDDLAEIPRRARTIHRKLNALLDTVLDDAAKPSCILPLGDGLLVLAKEREADHGHHSTDCH